MERWGLCMGCMARWRQKVQRTVKRTELTAFLCLLKKVNGPSRCMSTTQEFKGGYGEDKEDASIRKLAMLIW